MTNDKEITSGARSVEAQEHAASGLTLPDDPSRTVRETVNALGSDASQTTLGEMTFTLIQQGDSIHVRAGNATNASELFEGIYDSAEDANYELQQAGILKTPATLEVAATSLKLTGLTAEQLQKAGLKRHHTAGL